MDLKHRESKPDGKETRLDGKGPTTYLIGIIFLNGLKKLQNVFETYKIEHKPALDLIREFDSPDSFFYLDPPYLLNTRSAKQYQHEMTEEDHIQLLETNCALFCTDYDFRI